MMSTCIHPQGCDRPVKAFGWCRTHWDRIRKTCSPGSVKIRVPQPLGRPCKIQGCSTPVTNDAGYGMCTMHYQRFRTHGDVTVVKTGGASLALAANPNWSGQNASYSAMHLRLRRQRGRAADLPCVDCGDQAAHWSYDNTDPEERVDPKCGRYSTDVDRYAPRCVSCHKRFDNAARLEAAS